MLFARVDAPPAGQVLNCPLTREVSDASTCAPHIKHARTVGESGRGLFIVATLTDSRGTRCHAGGKTVWAQQSS